VRRALICWCIGAGVGVLVVLLQVDVHSSRFSSRLNLCVRTRVPSADAVSQLLTMLGMNACDGSENVEANRQKHILYMAGVFVTGVPLVARVRMRLAPTGGTQMELAVRSADPDVSHVMVSSL
jgi:Coatomer subunit gamma-1 C-terminal appendage platform